MAQTVNNENCTLCNVCQSVCPQDAIKTNADGDGFWIDPTLCNDCADEPTPLCAEFCEGNAVAKLQPKKGRCKSTLLPPAIPEIFLNGKTNPFASSIVIWESCNILAQRSAVTWQSDDDGAWCYQRSVNRGRGSLRFRLAADPSAPVLEPLSTSTAQSEDLFADFDIRAACVHLILAAQITTLNRPWEETLVINDQHFEQYIGLDKRRDLSKLDRLTLIKSLVYQCCRLFVAVDWPRQGQVPAFSLTEHPVWQLIDTHYYWEDDAQGHNHLIGLSFTLKAGRWAKHFLNQQDYRRHRAFYQYGTLPQSLLSEVMSNWQQHEGAVRLLLWLLFKLRLGDEHRMTVRTLLKIAYGEDRLTEATTVRGAHKRLLKTFEGDLEAIYHYGLTPIFDAETYPPDIQPLWMRVNQIPDSADEALDFWTADANHHLSLTDAAPRDKWQRLLNARLCGFELSEEWQQTIKKKSAKRRQPTKPPASRISEAIPSDVIKSARQEQQLSQRALAERLGKSQSWVRDVENGRFGISAQDQSLLRTVLHLVPDGQTNQD
jgi:DNA-binding transcriptional regulator YiaG/Pyruvate/2-oxoacid:ferredoxin oxidoreductase delta subunit